MSELESRFEKFQIAMYSKLYKTKIIFILFAMSKFTFFRDNITNSTVFISHTSDYTDTRVYQIVEIEIL